MEKYYSSVAPIIQEIGLELKKGFGKAEALAFKSSGHGSAVTEFDQKAEQFIAERLRKLYPDIEFFGEEFGGNNKAERFWLVDPIDGTSNFIRGIPFATTMIVLIQEGKPIFSIIYNFITQEMYSAEKGDGAKLNGNVIHVSNRPANHADLFVEINKRKKENLDKYLRVNEKFSILSTMSAGFEYCLVASGKVEARLTFDPYGNDYDYAPGAFLVAEAGGIVKNIASDSYDYRNHDFIAGNKEVYEELRRVLEK